MATNSTFSDMLNSKSVSKKPMVDDGKLPMPAPQKANSLKIKAKGSSYGFGKL